MKIDQSTIAILKNFAKINPSLLIKEGNILKTISTSKTIMASAVLTTSFSQRFAIYNLDRFLATLSLFNEPDLAFSDKFVTISSNNKKIKYIYADESYITKSPEKDIVLPSEDVKFKLLFSDFKDVEKAASVLSLPEVIISGDGKSIFLQTTDVKNTSGDVYSVLIGETDKTFKAVFKLENIRILPNDYDVTICKAGISLFKSENVEYFITVETSSTFD